MSKYQVGDKVKFLNQIGGGVVTKVTDDFVFVRDDTGFDIPMSPGELIRMADMTGAGKMFNDSLNGIPAAVGQPAAPQPCAPKRVQAPETPEDEIKRLRSQVASLRDQVAKLKQQIANMQRLNAHSVAENILAQYMTSPGEAEVDLHIENLAERPADLTPHEAFEIQMHYFRTCMNHAFANRVKKVVFIHGVGRGILRDEIQRELKQYDNIAVMDAPMSKYGAGAVEVYFR